MIILPFIIPNATGSLENCKKDYYECYNMNEENYSYNRIDNIITYKKDIFNIDEFDVESTKPMNNIDRLIVRIEDIVNNINSYADIIEYELGDGVESEFFEEIRVNFEYQSSFELMVSKFQNNTKYLFAYYLSLQNYSMLYSFESDFIVELLRGNNAQLQEIALQALENWKSNEVLEEVKGLKINNYYLQKEFDSLFD